MTQVHNVCFKRALLRLKAAKMMVPEASAISSVVQIETAVTTIAVGMQLLGQIVVVVFVFQISAGNLPHAMGGSMKEVGEELGIGLGMLPPHAPLEEPAPMEREHLA
jgi:hypothetical protein